MPTPWSWTTPRSSRCRRAYRAALAAVDVATAYVLTPNPLSVQGVIDAMTPGSTFLTLAPGGAGNLADALVRLRSTGDLLLAAIDELEAETDDQTNDIVKIDPDCCDGLTTTQEDLTRARDLIEDILDALSAPTLVTAEFGDTISFTADARQFFINPIEDLKAMLAPYEVFTAPDGDETVAVGRWLALNLDEWTFPDPTVNGILPDMSTTSDLLNTFPNFNEFFRDYSVTGAFWELRTVDGINCQEQIDPVTGSSTGCLVGSDFFNSGYIDFGDTEDGQLEVSITLWGFSGPPNYIDASVHSRGPYDVVDVGGDTYTVNMDTELHDDFGVPLGTPLVLAATLTDSRGFTIDPITGQYHRSSLEFSYLGSVWVFEQYPDGVISIR